MIVKTKLMKALGFKGSGMFVDSPSYSHYYKAIPEARCVLGLSNSCPSGIYVFRLTPEQYRAFERGKLGLVPPGCCNASGGKSVEDPAVLYEGPFNTSRQVTDLVTKFEATLRAEKALPSQRYRSEKRDSLRANGWMSAHGAEVWISSDNPKAKRLLVQVILADGRVGECQIDSTSERLAWD